MKIAAAAAVCMLSAVAAQAQTPPTPAPPAQPTGVCTIVGPLLGPRDFGVPAGQPVADTTAVLLADGRVRLYVFAQGRGIVSAISLTTEGTSFVAEPGTRLPDGSGMPRAVVLSDSRVRLFYTSGGGIKSAISSDGLTFVDEPGVRITAAAAGFASTTPGQPGATSGATVVQISDGRYRLYFSDLPRPGDPPGGHIIKSAVSRNQLEWTMEDGVRLGTGAPALTESAEHPFALVNPNGSVTLYYGKFGGPGAMTPEGLYQATSTDGLTFAQETLAVFFANDPDVVRLTDGTVMLYYGQFDPVVGGTINAARCPDPGASATGQAGR